MAWLYQYKGSKNWHIGWRVGGKLHSETTGTSDLAEAEIQLLGHQTIRKQHDAGKPYEKLVESLRAETGNSKPAWTLKLALDSWISAARKSTAQGTVDRYAGVARSFAEFMSATDAKPLLRDVTEDHVNAYLDKVMTLKSRSTTNQERRVLRVFWRRALAKKQTADNAVAGVEAIKSKKTKRSQFTTDEVRALLTKADPFWRFAIMTGFSTGLRISDIAAMTVDSADLGARVIKVTTIKTDTVVTIPIRNDLVDLIRARVAELGKNAKHSDYLWPTHAGMRSGVRSNQFHALLVQCGLAEARSHKARKSGRDAEREASTLSFHSLRHGFVSNLKATGATQAEAKELAGHSSDTMSDHYTNLPPELLRAAVEKLPSLV